MKSKKGPKAQASPAPIIITEHKHEHLLTDVCGCFGATPAVLSTRTAWPFAERVSRLLHSMPEPCTLSQSCKSKGLYS